MTPERKFYRKGTCHLFQISVDKSLVFCTDADMILLFTLICTKSKHYNVRITHACIMFNHFHIQAVISEKADMEKFMKSVTWGFAFLSNRKYGLSGKVFHKSYGSAPKWDPRKVAENMIYIANNPVVKNAVSSAGDYRWNFLRYASDGSSSSLHPFSEEYIPIEASREMQYLVKTVRCRARDGKIISYDFFDSKRYLSLSDKEKQQLIDIIIVTYNVIDYRPMLQKYGSVERYCNVLAEVAGNEYDIDDDWEHEDYRHYQKMMKISAEEGYDVSEIRYAGVEGYESYISSSIAQDRTLMPRSLGETLIKRFIKEVGASSLEVGKYMRIKNYGKSTKVYGRIC